VSLTRVQSEFTYSSASGGLAYLFEVVVDAQGLTSVRNIRTPTGAISSSSSLPETVLDDMCAAKDIVELLVNENEVASGTLTFTGQSEQAVAIGAGVLNNADYRVVYTPPDSTLLVTESKTTTGFNAVVGVSYGSVPDPKDVDYSVLVSTAASSSMSGVLTFVVADAGTKTVTFPTAVSTASYRVILTPDGFFVPRVTTQTTLGFTVELGHGLLGAETAVVGYDVFV